MHMALISLSYSCLLFIVLISAFCLCIHCSCYLFQPSPNHVTTSKGIFLFSSHSTRYHQGTPSTPGALFVLSNRKSTADLSTHIHFHSQDTFDTHSHTLQYIAQYVFDQDLPQMYFLLSREKTNDSSHIGYNTTVVRDVRPFDLLPPFIINHFHILPPLPPSRPCEYFRSPFPFRSQG
ncbi:hypothetical protein C8J55DRAFT_259975 [Lentinula edodes]|uniref:Uncharacterized protein n=1 Tax=Lentinula lateritia TaxID=40482 RepID=A0A9W8ZSH3_9AGAR|nr:hypothetical protein C8J55DRAFT_259975 [Lentinula edodes]